MYQRYLKIEQLLESKSLLLIGPRQTGKSTLIKSELPNSYIVNLAERDTFRTLAAHPEQMRQRLPPNCKFLVIDEAQLLPELFDEVQVIIDRDPKIRVLLTGSSARKLRRGGINLLPGRIWKKHLHPLVFPELGQARTAERVVRGSLPGILDSAQFKEELSNYVGLYLEEEIRAEGLTRAVGDFSRFLTVAALNNAELLNYSNVANDSQVKINTVRSYYQIIEDTLLGYQLEPFRETKSRKAIATSKFYLFDIGVVNGILNRYEIIPGTEVYGKMLEHLIFLELKAFIDYKHPNKELNFWRSQTKIEVDFLLDKNIAIEVKGSSSISPRDEKPMLMLAEEVSLKRRIIVCNESHPRKTDLGTEVLPVQDFLQRLWDGELA
jgi:predicted AAA+ superfamily ATPase